MTIFCIEAPPNTLKTCRIFCSALKEVFLNCHHCQKNTLSSALTEEDAADTDFDDVQEVLNLSVVVAIIRSRAMETKIRSKVSVSNSLSSIYHPISGELFSKTPKGETKEKEEKDDFMSVCSHFSHCSSCATAIDSEAFFSVQSDFTHLLSFKDMESHESNWWPDNLDTLELKRRAIIQEICHCQGWPFGLCRKSMLLPPLPKSPSDSWTWCKSNARISKMH